MDEVRKALGEEQINYLGYSYGTSLGQEYARLFPTHVRSMVLDGVVDHAPDGLDHRQGPGGRLRRPRSTAYIAHCEDDGCGFGDQDAGEVIDEVIAAAEKAPIPAPGADRAAGPGVVSLALAQALYSEQLWGPLSRGAARRPGGRRQRPRRAGRPVPGPTDDGAYEQLRDLLRRELPRRHLAHRPRRGHRRRAEAEQDVPRFGGAHRHRLHPLRDVADRGQAAASRCPPTPRACRPSWSSAPPTTRPRPTRTASPSPSRSPARVLVTNEGEGHTIVGQGKPCIDDMVTDYFVDLTVPEDGLVCDVAPPSRSGAGGSVGRRARRPRGARGPARAGRP